MDEGAEIDDLAMRIDISLSRVSEIDGMTYRLSIRSSKELAKINLLNRMILKNEKTDLFRDVMKKHVIGELAPVWYVYSLYSVSIYLHAIVSKADNLFHIPIISRYFDSLP